MLYGRANIQQIGVHEIRVDLHVWKSVRYARQVGVVWGLGGGGGGALYRSALCHLTREPTSGQACRNHAQ